MFRHISGKQCGVRELRGASLPQIVHAHAACGDAQVAKACINPVTSFAAIEQTDGPTAIGQRFHPDFVGLLLPNAASLSPQRVLVDRDHLTVQEDALDFLLHRAQIVAGEQRRRQERP